MSTPSTIPRLKTGAHRAVALAIAALLTSFVFASQPLTAAAGLAGRRPNIVIILADDLGWTDLGCMGSSYYETPRIDGLAREGVKFSAFYACPNCAPTRAALLSGQYAPRTGVYTVNTLERGRAEDRRLEVPENSTRLPLDRVTLAQALKSAGYATAIFGKWHLGGGEYHPSRRGFDEAVVSAGRHFAFETEPPVAVPEGAYLADFLTDLALGFIERHRERPFLLYLAHFAVHAPHQAKPELAARYEKKPAAGGHRSPTYAAMIESLDQSVGRVLDKLRELGLDERTLVVFSSDNGGVGGYQRTEPASERLGITDNSPLRGGKGTLYEGGIRVPFLVRWPGAVRARSICDVPAAHVDVFPTLLDLAGAKAPAAQALDGTSLVRLLEDPAGSLEREGIFWHFPGYLESYVRSGGWRTTPCGVVRAGDYKLLEFFEDGRVELYNLRDDIGEHQDLASKLPAKAAELRARLTAWRGRLGAPMPAPKGAGTAAESGRKRL
jgi:arylsulfatase A-like enzyme